MKTREGFVSNSSTSSFIVVGNDRWDKPEKLKISMAQYEEYLGDSKIVDDKICEVNFGVVVESGNIKNVEEAKDLFKKITGEEATRIASFEVAS